MSKKHSFIAVGLLTCMAAAVLLIPPPNPETYSTILPVEEKVYGAMSDDTTMNLKLATIQALGLSATRESVLTSTWKGKSARCEFWNRNNTQMYLNINSNPQGTGFEFPNDSIEIKDYTTKMVQIAKLYQPHYVFVENEELNTAYREGNLFGDYTKLFQAAIDSAHANGFKISNGGITSKQIVRLTYRWLWQTNDSAAAYFLANCVPVDDTTWLSNYMSDKKQEELLSTNAAILRWYSNVNIDAVNIHLYMPFKNRTKGTVSAKGNGTAGLNYIIEYLHSVLGDKKIISNEVGFVENDDKVSYDAFDKLYKAGIEVCYYGATGARKFTRSGLLTKLGTGIYNYTK